jgi:hypothetical protein
MVSTADDSGRTWVKSKLVWNASAGYSALVPVNDTHIGLVFENGVSSYAERISFVALPHTLE